MYGDLTKFRQLFKILLSLGIQIGGKQPRVAEATLNEQALLLFGMEKQRLEAIANNCQLVNNKEVWELGKRRNEVRECVWY